MNQSPEREKFFPDEKNRLSSALEEIRRRGSLGLIGGEAHTLKLGRKMVCGDLREMARNLLICDPGSQDRLVRAMDIQVATSIPDQDFVTPLSAKEVKGIFSHYDLVSGPARRVEVVQPGSFPVELVDYQLGSNRVQVITENQSDLRHPPCLNVDYPAIPILKVYLDGFELGQFEKVSQVEIVNFERLIWSGDFARLFYLICRAASVAATRGLLNGLVYSKPWGDYAGEMQFFLNRLSWEEVWKGREGLFATTKRDYHTAIYASRDRVQRGHPEIASLPGDWPVFCLIGYLLEDIIPFREMFQLQKFISHGVQRIEFDELVKTEGLFLLEA